MRRQALRDDQRERLKDPPPGREGHAGVTAKDNRLFVEAVLFRHRAGIPWRDPPERLGDWNKARTRFSRRARRGAWAKIFQRLAGGEADNEHALVDGAIGRAPQRGAGAIKKAAAVATRKPSAAAAAARAPRSTPGSMPGATRPASPSRRGGRATWKGRVFSHLIPPPTSWSPTRRSTPPSGSSRLLSRRARWR